MQGLACNILCYGDVIMGFEERAIITFITINIFTLFVAIADIGSNLCYDNDKTARAFATL